MNGVILYYSGSGNTKLACEYISRHINNADIDLIDIARVKNIPELSSFDIVGFATYASWFGPAYLVEQFMEKIPKQKGKLSFVFNTYGIVPGKTLKILAKWATEKGFRVVSGHSLHTPENYPPNLIKGKTSETSPNEKEMKKFNIFITELDEAIKAFQNGGEIRFRKIKISIASKALPVFSYTKVRDKMGNKYVNELLCNECGVCEKGCPYQAIYLAPKPQFDMNKCYGCWYCYNHCPTKAIYTNECDGSGQYSKPNNHLKEKLKD